ncbi:MAG: ABC-F family ATP-binding cassette domain-containing protein [Oscillospiraceae bacterium]|jgi:ATP-binding cassette subfamily F protein 3|nr:ABC-F family ATP-binding cassette domain-containing protein [Oscillospiraceae bacterium]
MAIASLQNLSFSFEDRLLFSGVNLMVEPRERVGLVGPNGCGKTTLLRLILGELEPESGAAVLGSGVRVGFAAQMTGDGQDGPAGGEATVSEELLAVFAPLMELERQLEDLHRQIHAHPEEALLHRQSELTEAFERGGGLTFRSRAKAALAGLGFPEETHGLPCSALSGGQRAKLRLGRLLLSGADLLLLDEPTNHLDLYALAWLEDFLAAYPGAVILVSHDRFFLDRATNRTAELSHRRLRLWKGGYSDYLAQKQTQAELDRRHYENQMAEIRHIEEIIEQQRRFGQKRNFITIESKQKMLERKKAELTVPEGAEGAVRFQFPPVLPSGNEVLRLRGLAKSYGGKILFRNLEALIERGDRAVILGPNGCGKTTLLQIIRRRLQPDAGYVSLGASVRPGSYDQDLAGSPSPASVLDDVWDARRSLTQTEVRSLLAAFLFRGEDVFRPVHLLSGGERARVALCKLILSGANLLLLDEPTNHLDVASRETLERALLQFDGTILAVSHDRYFINRLATKVFALTPEGLTPCGASYDDYLTLQGGSAAGQSAADTPAKEEKTPNEYQLRKQHAAEERRRQTALVRCEADIARRETDLTALQTRLSAPETAADYETLLALTREAEAAQAALEKLYAAWEELENKGADLPT